MSPTPLAGHAGEVVQHPPADAGWQESFLYIWHDPGSGIAGFHRLGIEPDHGRANVLSAVFTEDGLRQRRYLPDERSLVAVPGGSRCSVGPLSLVLGSEPTVEYHDENVDLALRFDDLQAAIQEDLEDGDGGFRNTNLASDHYEFTCRVQGTVSIGGRTFPVDGLGFRDHSWGVRDWAAIRAHRSCIGTIGPSLSWSTLVMATPGLGVTSRGVVVRDGVPTLARAVDTLCYLEPDGFTHRGGRCVIELVDDTRLELDLEVIDSPIYQLRDFYSVEGICRIRVDGQLVEGFCLLEMSNNPRRGIEPPDVIVRAGIAEGLSSRETTLSV